MGLFLSQEEMWDRPLGGTSNKKQIPHWFGNLAYVVIGFLCKILFRYSVQGRENLRAFKDVSGVVVVCNHTSFLDVVFMYLAARPSQWLRLMGRDSLFDNADGLLGQILSRVGAFPVKRDSADRTAIKRASTMLKNNELVGILPEGTRRGKGTLTPELHSGAAFVAKMGHAPLLPMTVRNAENVKKKGERIHFPKVTVEYGTPILLGDFDFLHKAERLEAATWYAMRECFALSQNIAAADVDMVALFPDNKDYSAVFAEHPLPAHTSKAVVQGLLEASQDKERAARAKDDASESAEEQQDTSATDASQSGDNR